MNISDLIKTGVEAGLLNTLVSYPAIVESFDPEKQTIKAQIAIKRINAGVDEAISVLVDVPIMLPTVSGFTITMPIKKGDEVLLLFADRAIDGWFESGKVSKQVEHRQHHLSDAFALIGINSKPNVIPGYNTENMEIRNTVGDQKISLKPDGAIEAVTTGDVKVETPAAITATCSSCTLSASGSVVIDSPSVTISGSLTVAGMISAPSVIAATALSVGGKEMSGHAHSGVSSGSATSGPPV